MIPHSRKLNDSRRTFCVGDVLKDVHADINGMVVSINDDDICVQWDNGNLLDHEIEACFIWLDKGMLAFV